MSRWFLQLPQPRSQRRSGNVAWNSLALRRPWNGVDCVVSVAGSGDGAAWDAFINRAPDATGYHLWAWRRVFEGALRHEPVYLVAHQGGELVGALPLVFIDSFLFGRSLTSLPFVNYGGVLAADNDVADALGPRG